MILKKLLFTLLLIILVSFKNLCAYENKIVLKIDNEIITQLDIINEIQYLKILNPNIIKLERKKIYSIGKNSLIREKIKQIEILKYVKKIQINQKILDELIKSKYYELNLSSKKEFLNFLKQYSIDLNNIERKITIEALWNQIIFSKFSTKIRINKEKLKKQIKNNNKLGIKSYLLSEIQFTVPNKNQLDSKYNNIKKTILANGFENAALLHSKSDTAELGGKLGWIREDTLNRILKKELSDLEISSITKPILTSNGFLILKIEDIKFLKKEFDLKKELEELINLKTNEQLSQFSNYYFDKIKKDIVINEL
jgi:peptidyl-prolyl cis-trans isomerase SurA